MTPKLQRPRCAPLRCLVRTPLLYWLCAAFAFWGRSTWGGLCWDLAFLALFYLAATITGFVWGLEAAIGWQWELVRRCRRPEPK